MAVTDVQDDYIDCSAYQEQINQKSEAYPGFITFQKDENHFFAWVNGNEILMRSEAYPDADKNERGIKAILKNCDLTERYAVIEEDGHYLLVMYGGGDHSQHTGNFEKHSEIGRSCPHKSREALNALLQFKGSDFANKVVPISGGKTVAAAAVVAGAGATVAAVTNVVSDATAKVKESSSAVTSAGVATVASATAAVSALGANASDVASNVGDAAKNITGDAVGALTGSTGGGMGWLKWLLPLLLIGGAFLLWKGCNKNEARSTNADAGTVVTDTTNKTNGGVALVAPKVTIDSVSGVVNYELGALSDIELPGGTKLTGIAKDGFENTLINFIKTGKIDTINKKANWFNLHDVQFVTNQTTYATPKALAQIKNVAAVLKAYPNVVLKLGGNTDVTGNANLNKDLSDRRAKQVMKDLIANGAAASQIKEAVGYGSEFAEAKAGDKEGMARDRKTTAKVASM